MTESSGIATCVLSPEPGQEKPKRKPATVGSGIPSVSLKVIDLQTGEALGPNTTGEICIHSPLVMLGYLNNKEATAATIDSDGWLHSGDIGYYDEDGDFFVVDRVKELIKCNAYQVAPAELETVLLSHGDVADAGVIGIPDASYGELPTAWVVRKPNASITELQLKQFVDGLFLLRVRADRVAPYKRLRGGVKFVTTIPKTASGKILRREMKAQLATNNNA